MPEIGRIQSTTFQSLLDELGITRNNIPFALRSEVTPVVLVGGTVSFLASPTPAYRVTDIFTEGAVGVNAAGTLLADTGPLVIGAYTLFIYSTATEPLRADFQWRDALNAASLRTWELISAIDENLTLQFRVNVENDNERFRVLSGTAIAAGQTWQTTIMAKV